MYEVFPVGSRCSFSESLNFKSNEIISLCFEDSCAGWAVPKSSVTYCINYFIMLLSTVRLVLVTNVLFP